MNKISSSSLKKDFLAFNFNDKISYLDNAATTQVPIRVANQISDFMNFGSGSPHRGSHKLSIRATETYENARKSVAKFIKVDDVRGVIFTSGTTESLNLLAGSFTRDMISNKTKILVFITSHHSNILPWQMLSKKYGLKLEYIYINKNFEIDESEYEKINEEAFLVAFPIVSNGLGLAHDTKKIVEIAKKYNVITIADAAQALSHIEIDVEKSGFDFFAFSSHKIYGPTGVGVLYGRPLLLEKMQPYKLGGDMIEYVTEQDATYAQIPSKFEAGTQNVEGAFGLMKAIDYINEIGVKQIIELENEIVEYALSELKKIKEVDIIGGDYIKRSSIITFNLVGIHPHDVAFILDTYNVSIRAGHHCCQPLMTYLGLNSTCRLSVSFYNDKSDIDNFIKALKEVKEVFR